MNRGRPKNILRCRLEAGVKRINGTWGQLKWGAQDRIISRSLVGDLCSKRGNMSKHKNITIIYRISVYFVENLQRVYKAVVWIIYSHSD